MTLNMMNIDNPGAVEWGEYLNCFQQCALPDDFLLSCV